MAQVHARGPAPAGRARVGLLECDHVDRGLRDVDGDYGEMFTALLGRHAPELDLTRIDVIGGAPLPAVDAYDALLVSGSRFGATDALPWIDALADLLRRAHAADLPTVGICFGHQLIAHALGGTVERAAAGWGVGVHRAVPTSAGEDAFAGPRPFDLLLSHQDQVVDLPPGAELLATSAHAPVAALRAGSMLGFQGHPEFSAGYAAALMDSRADRIPAAVRTAARPTLATPTDHATVARWIADHLGAGSG